jgi:hypothetical protein
MSFVLDHHNKYKCCNDRNRNYYKHHGHDDDDDRPLEELLAP